MADASSLASPYKHPRSKLMHLIQYQSSHNPSTLLAHHITISRSAIRSIYTRLSTRSDIEMQRVHRVSHSTAHCIIACMYWNEMQSNLCLRHSYHIIGKPTPYCNPRRRLLMWSVRVHGLRVQFQQSTTCSIASSSLGSIDAAPSGSGRYVRSKVWSGVSLFVRLMTGVA